MLPTYLGQVRQRLAYGLILEDDAMIGVKAKATIKALNETIASVISASIQSDSAMVVVGGWYVGLAYVGDNIAV